MTVNIEGDKLIRWLSNRWEHPSTIVYLCLAVTFVLVWKFTGSDLSDLTLPEIAAIFLVLGILVVAWWLSNAVPRAKRGCIGFAVAIQSETQELEKTITADFIAELRRLIVAGPQLPRFSFVEIPQRLVKRVTDPEDARKLMEKARAHFLVLGSAKLRTVNNTLRHILNLDVYVIHSPIPKALSANLSKEMGELFPRRIEIDTKNDLRGFEFTSEYLGYVARYLIGVAALLSSDLSYAETLFSGLRQDSHFQQSPLPALKKVQQRLPIRLADIYAEFANRCYEAWRHDRSIDHMEEMWSFLVKLRCLRQGHYPGRLLAAIYFFVARRNIGAAERELEKCRNESDATWRFSYAFLLAYRGNMLKARRMYNSAFRHSIERQDVPFQTEEFLLWALENEPDKAQLHFCLGLINWHAKEDIQQAIVDFERFLSLETSKDFPNERKLASGYIERLSAQWAARPTGDTPSAGSKPS